ncbi:MAG: hypothetical protein PHS44_05620 [Candidatus Dojkabacteria bacterium]|nr:hypothetical protein [Candidatus Dojkabacteria bacterium]
MEEIGIATMRDMLAEEGIVFIPKREFDIPADNPRRVARLVSDPEGALGDLGILKDFLLTPAADDNFGTDHEARKQWVARMKIQYGEVFSRCYPSLNQLNANGMSSILLPIEFLAESAEKRNSTRLARTLRRIHSELHNLYNGKNPRTSKKYTDIANREEKLLVLHTFEDAALEVLSLFSHEIVDPRDFIGRNLLGLSDAEINLFLAEETLNEASSFGGGGIGYRFTQCLQAIQQWRLLPELFTEELKGELIFEG